jgi:hypothetical protein
VIPVDASVTDAPTVVAVVSDGRAGLALLHAAATARRASTLHTLRDFFMSSYRCESR